MNEPEITKTTESANPIRFVLAHSFTIASFFASLTASYLFGTSTTWGSPEAPHTLRFSLYTLIIAFGTGLIAVMREPPIWITAIAVLFSLFVFIAIVMGT